MKSISSCNEGFNSSHVPKLSGRLVLVDANDVSNLDGWLSVLRLAICDEHVARLSTPFANVSKTAKEQLPDISCVSTIHFLSVAFPTEACHVSVLNSTVDDQ